MAEEQASGVTVCLANIRPDMSEYLNGTGYVPPYRPVEGAVVGGQGFGRKQAGGDAAKRRALVVVGMHRSGTSAVARGLSLLGASLPRTPLPPGRRDEEMHWGESNAIVELHEELLASADSSWDDVSPFPVAWYGSPAADEYRERMVRVTADEYMDSSLFVVKDPRICRLVPFWIAVLEKLDVQPFFVLPVRNPLEVAGSLAHRNGFRAPKGILLWLRHVLDAERDTREHPRAFVAYEDLLRDPRSSTRAIRDRLGLDWPPMDPRAEAELEGFLSADERHHEVPVDELNTREDMSEWVRQAYGSLLDACRSDDDLDIDLLDRLSAGLANADLTYGSALAESELRAGELREQIRARDRSLGALERQHRRAAVKLRESGDRLRVAEKRLRSKERELAKARTALASLEGSLSWRLTRPLRAARALIRRPRSRAKEARSTRRS